MEGCRKRLWRALRTRWPRVSLSHFLVPAVPGSQPRVPAHSVSPKARLHPLSVLWEWCAEQIPLCASGFKVQVSPFLVLVTSSQQWNPEFWWTKRVTVLCVCRKQIPQTSDICLGFWKGENESKTGVQDSRARQECLFLLLGLEGKCTHRMKFYKVLISSAITEMFPLWKECCKHSFAIKTPQTNFIVKDWKFFNAYSKMWNLINYCNFKKSQGKEGGQSD